jgi:hypothetical protein
MTQCETCIHCTVCQNLDFFNEISSGVICEHYEDKNLFVKLPCAIGSQVWVISKNSAEPYPAKFKFDDIPNIGKRVFFSRASAIKHMRGVKR